MKLLCQSLGSILLKGIFNLERISKKD